MLEFPLIAHLQRQYFLKQQHALQQIISDATILTPLAGQHFSILAIKIDNYRGLTHLFGEMEVFERMRLLRERLIHSLSPKAHIFYIEPDLFYFTARVECAFGLDIWIDQCRHNMINLGCHLFGINQPIYFILRSASVVIGMVQDLFLGITDLLELALGPVAQRYPSQHIYHHIVYEYLIDVRRQQEMAGIFYQAISQKQLQFVYQPIISASDGRVAYYEALLRMNTRDNRLLSAGPFIGIAEQFGFIDLVDDFVLEHIANEIKRFPRLSLSFNLSRLGLNNTAWLQKAHRLLRHSDMAKRVIVEITETALQEKHGTAIHCIAALQDLGCKVALDDFGSGHTSLQQLRHYPIDIVKIDGTLIRNVHRDLELQQYVRTINDICKAFNLSTVAEFVEDAQDLKILLDLKIDYMQGYYFGQGTTYRPWE
jgi:EAL domain-containing protein (putative c-di-GMP-specific phosphodiesterase class I)